MENTNTNTISTKYKQGESEFMPLLYGTSASLRLELSYVASFFSTQA